MITRLVFCLFMVVMLSTCRSSHERISETQIPLLWVDLTLYIAKNTPANSPTFASRAFGYLGLTMYESVVHGSPHHQSLAGQLNGLANLPLPSKAKAYNWAAAMNAGQAEILRCIYAQTSNENKAKIDSLENIVYTSLDYYSGGDNIIKRSADYGRAVAAAIFKWSKTDGGHRGYLKNFDGNFKMPLAAGSWRPPFLAQTTSRFPLHPYWGNNRTFLPADANWKIPKFIPYDTARGSVFYNQFQEVYLENKELSEEQKEIALWWNDDPSETYTPPGHSYNLARIAVRTLKPDIFTAAETFARTGMAVADAFIVCWRIKYTFFSERPSTYVFDYIDDQWDPFWPDPPFPAFPSGHATQAAAVATVLAAAYGDSVSFVDDTHAGRSRDLHKNVEYKARRFTSFWQAAEEAAYSRFLGGIHTKQDNEVGLQEGSKIGKHINDLKWYK